MRPGSEAMMVISSSSSDWTWTNEDTSPVSSLIQSLLVSISEITASVVCINIEQESFMELGSYLYRASPAIIELQTTKNTPENAMRILQSLSKSVDLAKNLVGQLQKDSHPISDPELGSIIEQLEGVIKLMGEELSLIPPSTFGDQEYAEIAVRSVSKEMQNARFGVCQTQVTSPKALQPRALSLEELPKEQVPTERDLYSIDFSTDNPQLPDIPHHMNVIPKSKCYRSQRNHENMSYGSLKNMPQVTQFMEPFYETFFCPLTKNIMEDPVTIESGVTYERKAITEWFEKYNNSAKICCPATGQKLRSKGLSTNIALKTTIEEWKERNEAAGIKVARSALSLAISESMVLEALNDLQSICGRKPYNKVQIRNVGMLPLLVKFLEYKDTNVRRATLELLRELAEDDEGKEMVAKVMDISTTIKMLSSDQQPIRHAALLFLLELSRSQSLCEKIGSAAGGILMLITIKYNWSFDAFALEKADEILKNLERSPNNIKCMADNGYLEPLLHHLIEGCEEMKMEMGNYLGEIALGHDSKTYVAERASPALVKMLHTGNALTKKAAFKALEQISSYHPNGKILVEAGIVKVMVEEMLNPRKIYNETMNSIKEAAAILGNLLESGIEFENLQVNTHGHTMGSHYIVYSIIHMLKNSTPDELNTNLIRILLCLAKSPKSNATIVSVVRETEASYTLIELINNPHEELGIASMKLLVTLSPYLGHTFAERLCKTRGQPESLIQSPAGTNQITEKQAVSANFLADLPHQNLRLNLALLSNDSVPMILQSIHQMQRSGTRTSRYASAYLEGLVGIIVRFTTTLFEPQMLFLARNYNFTSVLTELLTKTSSDKVQRLSAIGLKNLSSESVNLSKPPQIKRTKFLKFFKLPRSLSAGSSKSKKIQVCPVHRGACSSQNTFCLVDAKAVERLLACLEHENAEVIEAALSALCTLLDDKVDVDKSVSLLSGVDCIQHVLNVVKEHREEGLREKSLWVIERFLMKGGDRSASYISQDRSLPATLVSAFHHGDGSTKQMAAKILRHLNQMPKVTTNFTI